MHYSNLTGTRIYVSDHKSPYIGHSKTLLMTSPPPAIITGFQNAAMLINRPAIYYDGTNAASADRVNVKMIDITGNHTKDVTLEYVVMGHATSNASYTAADANYSFSEHTTTVGSANVMRYAIVYYTPDLFGELLVDESSNVVLQMTGMWGWYIVEITSEKSDFADVTYTNEFTGPALAEPAGGYQGFTYRTPAYPDVGNMLVDGTYLTITVQNALESLTRVFVYDTSLGANITGSVYPIGSTAPGDGCMAGSDCEELYLAIDRDPILGVGTIGTNMYESQSRRVIHATTDFTGQVFVTVEEEGWTIVSASVNSDHGTIIYDQ